MMKLKLFFGLLIFFGLLMTVMTLPLMGQSKFVVVKDGHFEKAGKPYYFVGTNFWYGAILGSEGQGGNRQRLCQELDLMKQMGIDNLRILVGSDGERGVTTKVEPTLQVAPGVYNDTILAGLDFLMQEMGKRQMVAVLYLNNSWEWSGGYGFYLHSMRRTRRLMSFSMITCVSFLPVQTVIRVWLIRTIPPSCRGRSVMSRVPSRKRCCLPLKSGWQRLLP